MRKAPPLPESDNTVAHGSDFVRAIGDRDSVRGLGNLHGQGAWKGSEHSLNRDHLFLTYLNGPTVVTSFSSSFSSFASSLARALGSSPCCGWRATVFTGRLYAAGAAAVKIGQMAGGGQDWADGRRSREMQFQLREQQFQLRETQFLKSRK